MDEEVDRRICDDAVPAMPHTALQAVCGVQTGIAIGRSLCGAHAGKHAAALGASVVFRVQRADVVVALKIICSFLRFSAHLR